MILHKALGRSVTRKADLLCQKLVKIQVFRLKRSHEYTKDEFFENNRLDAFP